MKSILMSIMAILIVFNVQSQDETDTTTIDDYYIDFVIPDLAAYSLLGLENDQIVRPGNLKEFGVAISSLVGTGGNFNPSMGIEYAPFMTLFKKNEDYWKSNFKWQNLALSLATQVDDSLGNRIAFGFKWVPIDKSEPLGDPEFNNKLSVYLKNYGPKDYSIKKQNFQNSLAELLTADGVYNESDQKIGELLNISDEDYVQKIRKDFSEQKIGSVYKYLTDSIKTLTSYQELSTDNQTVLNDLVNYFTELLFERDNFNEYIKEKIKEAKEAFKKKHWNALAIQISAGWVYNSPTANYNDLDDEKFSSFISLAVPLGKSSTWLGKHGQIIFHGQHTQDESILTSTDKRSSFGSRVLLGNADNRLSIEGLYSSSSFDADVDDETFFRWSVGGEIKLSQGSWLEIAFGGLKQIEGETSILPSFGIKHALQNKRRKELN